MTGYKLIRWIRKELRLKQFEFAQLLGVTPGYISQLESDDRTPSANLYRKIAHECKKRGIGVSLEDLMKK